MIQDIKPYKFDNHYIARSPLDDSYMMIFSSDGILATEENGEISFPKFSDIAEFSKDTIYLFSISDKTFFIERSTNAAEKLLSIGYTYHSLSSLRRGSPRWLCFAGETAHQLALWYFSNSFCGRCGKPMQRDSIERMMRCECGNMVYPKICPAVIVGIIDGDRILLTRYADSRGITTRYALIGGFAEVGETIEDTVRREVMEEVGIKVKNLRYYKSQPWSFTDTLLFGFFCELDGSDKITLDENELSEAVWIRRDELDISADGISLTNEMIVAFKNNKME